MIVNAFCQSSVKTPLDSKTKGKHLSGFEGYAKRVDLTFVDYRINSEFRLYFGGRQQEAERSVLTGCYGPIARIGGASTNDRNLPSTDGRVNFSYDRFWS